MSANKKDIRRQRRRHSIRKKVMGTSDRPRLTISRSIKHIYAQAIDDQTGTTLASASSLNDGLVASLFEQGEMAQGMAMCRAVGRAVAQRLQEKNVSNVVFDRNGYLYHGRVKAIADGAREGGIEF